MGKRGSWGGPRGCGLGSRARLGRVEVEGRELEGGGVREEGVGVELDAEIGLGPAELEAAVLLPAFLMQGPGERCWRQVRTDEEGGAHGDGVADADAEARVVEAGHALHAEAPPAPDADADVLPFLVVKLLPEGELQAHTAALEGCPGSKDGRLTSRPS